MLVVAPEAQRGPVAKVGGTPAAGGKPDKLPPAPLVLKTSEETGDELPFWIDYLLPVGGGGLLLFILWLLAVLALW
jgi:hypothetical protein